MKIQLSLRLYLLGLLFLLSLAMATFFSLQSANYFLRGIGEVSSDVMEDIGQQASLSSGGVASLLDHHVTDDWQKVPVKIREQFPSPPEEAGIMHKRFLDWTYFSPPKKILHADAGDHRRR